MAYNNEYPGLAGLLRASRGTGLGESPDLKSLNRKNDALDIQRAQEALSSLPGEPQRQHSGRLSDALQKAHRFRPGQASLMATGITANSPNLFSGVPSQKQLPRPHAPSSAMVSSPQSPTSQPTAVQTQPTFQDMLAVNEADRNAFQQLQGQNVFRDSYSALPGYSGQQGYALPRGPQTQGISFASPEQIAAYRTRTPEAGTKAWYDAMGPGQADIVNQIGSIQGAYTGDMRAASRLVDDGRGGYKRVADGGLAAQAAKTAAISPLAKALAELRGEQLSAEGEDRRTSALERNAALGAETAQGQTAALERNAALTARTAQQQIAENRQQFRQTQGLDERKHLADEAERAEASRLAAQKYTDQPKMLDLGSRGSIPYPENWPIMSDAERAAWIEWGHSLGDNSVLPELPK